MSSLLVKADLPAFYVGGVKAKPPKLDFPQHLAALRKLRIPRHENNHSELKKIIVPR